MKGASTKISAVSGSDFGITSKSMNTDLRNISRRQNRKGGAHGICIASFCSRKKRLSFLMQIWREFGGMDLPRPKAYKGLTTPAYT